MKRFLSLILSIVMIFSLALPIQAATITVTDEDGNTKKLNDFLDTYGHWAHDVILKWADYSLILGDNGKFMPNKPITRGDLCVILDRMLGLKLKAYNFFYDLSNTAYYAEPMLKCVAYGYITGTSSTTIDATGYATREQIATILCRMLSLDTSNYTNVQRFADDGDISAWARPYVYTMRKYGYMNGSDGKFNPRSNITRAEFVQAMNNIAGAYMPKSDSAGQGNSFKSDFASNLMTARAIELTNSRIVGDCIVTQSASSLTMRGTSIGKRLYAMDKTTIDIQNCNINQIYLSNGKSTITGMNKNNEINSVYVAIDASESSLDAVPNLLYLEPGARVVINTIFYENETTSLKTYKGEDINEALADEQGYVVGGPRVSSVTITQDIYNLIKVSGLKITVGDNEVKEIGVVWNNVVEHTDNINPTYSKNEGSMKYQYTNVTEEISFDVGTISGHKIYRVYIKDDEGLYAYSNPFIFEAYDFNIDLSISDNGSYPAKVLVDLELKGENVPVLNSAVIISDINGLYKEKHNQTYLNQYRESNVEVESDSKKYLRFTGEINSDSTWQGYDQIFNPPTDFGYILTFRTGDIINKFPVIENVVPKGSMPVGQLSVGNASFRGNTLYVNNCVLTTSYIAVQEVGVAYIESSRLDMDEPTGYDPSWTFRSSATNIATGQTYNFSSSYGTSGDKSKITYFIPYVKTSSGYYFGNLSKIPNSWIGDEGSIDILGVNVDTLNEEKAVLRISAHTYSSFVSEGLTTISVTAENNVVSHLNGKTLTDLGGYVENPNTGDGFGDITIYVPLEGLRKGTNYSVAITVLDTSNRKSATTQTTFNTNNPSVTIQLAEKNKDTYGYTYYKVIYNTPKCFINTTNPKVQSPIVDMNSIKLNAVQERPNSFLYIRGFEDDDLPKVVLIVNSIYYMSNSKTVTFDRSIVLY